MTLVTLVTGHPASAREAAIASRLDPHHSSALILEGMPDGSTCLDPFLHVDGIQIARIAPGCMCCTGNLTLRVTLNRILRHPPARLYMSLATTSHIDEVRQFLSSPPYDRLLELTANMEI